MRSEKSENRGPPHISGRPSIVARHTIFLMNDTHTFYTAVHTCLHCIHIHKHKQTLHKYIRRTYPPYIYQDALFYSHQTKANRVDESLCQQVVSFLMYINTASTSTSTITITKRGTMFLVCRCPYVPSSNGVAGTASSSTSPSHIVSISTDPFHRDPSSPNNSAMNTHTPLSL